jgi:CheY-like chemotaxis protein
MRETMAPAAGWPRAGPLHAEKASEAMPDTSCLDAHILIVDDLEVNVLVLQGLLGLAGYRHVAALTDPRAVTAWCTMHRPDLILLDLMMPYLDGFAVMEHLAAQQPIDSAAILVVTADINVMTRRRALLAGARDVLTKPVERVQLLARVHAALADRQAIAHLPHDEAASR